MANKISNWHWNPWAVWTSSHWDFLCSDRPNLNQMRWCILVIVSFMDINSDIITIWWTKLIKLTWEIILMKMKISARWRHCSKIFKTNLKTHISPLLNHSQGCQGCQKNQKDLRITTRIRFAANFQPNLKKIQKITNFRRLLLSLKIFMQFIQFWLKTSAKMDRGCDS